MAAAAVVVRRRKRKVVVVGVDDWCGCKRSRVVNPSGDGGGSGEDEGTSMALLLSSSLVQVAVF